MCDNAGSQSLRRKSIAAREPIVSSEIVNHAVVWIIEIIVPIKAGIIIVRISRWRDYALSNQAHSCAGATPKSVRDVIGGLPWAAMGDPAIMGLHERQVISFDRSRRYRRSVSFTESDMAGGGYRHQDKERAIHWKKRHTAPDLLRKPANTTNKD